MQLNSFKLERYFAAHEFTARYLLSASDCESVALPDLLALSDDETRGMWEGLWLGYTESQGHPRLRQAIAESYTSVGAEQVLVAAPEEAIFIAMNALLSPGDEVIVTWPAYQSLTEVAQSTGCRVVRWPLEYESERWRLDLDRLADAITPRTRMLVVNFPHNPTGYLPPKAEWEAIVDLARREGLYLFSDEMYRLLEGEGVERLASGCDAYERGITLSGLSKSYGLPGLRIGWLATQDGDVLARCAALKDYTTICSSAPSEILAIIALRARDTLVSRNREIIDHNLRLAHGFFRDHLVDFGWSRPTAGPVAFPRLAVGVPVDQWCNRVLAETGVMIVPAGMFDYEGQHFRLGLGRKSFGAALEALAQGLR